MPNSPTIVAEICEDLHPTRTGLSARVLLDDDHALVRGGSRLLLKSEPDIDVVGEAEDGLAAVALTEELEPDVLVMDISMPKINGIASTRRIHRVKPQIGVGNLTVAADVWSQYLPALDRVVVVAQQEQSGEIAIDPSCCPTCCGGETVPLELTETNV